MEPIGIILRGGGVNGFVVIIGQMLAPFRKRIRNHLHVDEDSPALRIFQRLVVFCLITITWVFFRNGVSESFYIIRNIIFLNPRTFFDFNLFRVGGSVLNSFFTAVLTAEFCLMQNRRQDGGGMYRRYGSLPFFAQCILAAGVLCICIFGVCSVETSANTQFLYFDF